VRRGQPPLQREGLREWRGLRGGVRGRGTDVDRYLSSIEWKPAPVAVEPAASAPKPPPHTQLLLTVAGGAGLLQRRLSRLLSSGSASHAELFLAELDGAVYSGSAPARRQNTTGIVLTQLQWAAFVAAGVRMEMVLAHGARRSRAVRRDVASNRLKHPSQPAAAPRG